jgi:hypothetical protein
MSGELRIIFSDSSPAEQSRLASTLRDSLVAIKDVRASILREHPETQDPGTTLSVILAAPAVVLAVKALAAWLVRHNQSGITIQKADGTVIIKNMRSEDVPKVIEALKDLAGR